MTTAAFEAEAWLSALPVLLSLALLGWLLSLAVKSVDMAGALWPAMVLAACVSYALDSDPRAPLLASVPPLVVFWAARLGVYLVTRRAAPGAERRYGELRGPLPPHFALRSLYLVFVPLALLAWIVSLPLLGALASIRPPGFPDDIGLLLFAIGCLFEPAIDGPLARFLPPAARAAMDRGHSRLARHPNYFSEALIWWGFWFLALAAGAWWALPAPVLVSWLALRAARLRQESDSGNQRPQDADYVLKTNAFFPAGRRK